VRVYESSNKYSIPRLKTILYKFIVNVQPEKNKLTDVETQSGSVPPERVSQIHGDDIGHSHCVGCNRSKGEADIFCRVNSNLFACRKNNMSAGQMFMLLFG
jgi:predicted ArsR family transcriptional regulator